MTTSPAGLRVLLEKASFTRLQADYLAPNSDGYPDGWRIHDFPDEPAHVAYEICNGMEEDEAKLFVALVNNAEQLIGAAERAERYEAALRKIINDDQPLGHPEIGPLYSVGIAAGHGWAADIARQALGAQDAG
jgi:hypothetical protein